MLPKTLFPYYYHRHTDMKLEPTAKPIRIRIKLGNSEYSSLDSVKSNFSINELYPLFKDGRLERWLEQIGEKQFAHRTGELSKQCGDGNMKDYIQFLSLFFDEVKESLSAFKGEEWSLNDYLSSTPLDTQKFIYAQTMEMETEEIDWGEEFAKLVTDVEKYKDLFTFLERLSRNNPQPERCRKTISTFYSNCSQKGYQWASAFKDEMSLDYIADLYQNECFQIPDVDDWGELLAECVKDWTTDSERIEKIIKSEHNISFYKRCVENGFEEAKRKLLDSWHELANSDEYEIIIRAINDFGKSKLHFNKDNYNYTNLKSLLGKQILDFLQSLRDLKYKTNYSWGNENIYDSYLKDVKKVIICFNKSSYIYFTPEQEEYLKAMRKRGVELAGYALDNYWKDYLDIAQHAVDLFRKKLTKERM